MNRALLHSSIETAVQVDFARSGGPGGQNVNKVNSKAIARIELTRIEGLSAAERDQLEQRLASRITTAGELIVASEEERDQARNREIALARLEALIVGAAHLLKPRKATKPTRASRERRLASKRVHSAGKRLRGRPEDGG